MSFQNSRAYYLSVLANLGGMTLGYDNGIGGGVIALHSFQNAFYGKALTPQAIADLSSNVVSVLFGGAFVGSIAAAPIGGYLGYRYALMVSCATLIIGAMIQIAHTSNIGYIYGGRVVSGLGIGMISSLTPIYVAESAPKEIRGRLTGIFQLFLVIGGLIAYFFTYGLSLHFPIENRQWRLALGVQAVPAGLMLIGLLFTVESPRWLAGKYRDVDGLRNLAYLRKRGINDSVVCDEYAEIIAQRDEELENGATFKELLLPGNRYRFFAGTGVAFFWNASGNNYILYYGPTVFQSVGYTSANAALLATGIFTVIKVSCTLVFLLFCIERYGRRRGSLVGSFAQALSLFILGGLLSKHPAIVGEPPSGAGKAMIAMIYIYVVVFSLTWGPIGWIYMSEIFPARLRRIGMAACMAVTWVVNYAISKVTPIALVNIGWKFWMVLGCINSLSGIFVFFLPETKGVSLEEMDLLFGTTNAAIRENNIKKAACHLGPERAAMPSQGAESERKRNLSCEVDM